MLSDQNAPTPSTPLDEYQLRDELRALRTRIPDAPRLNPIVSLAFDLSRRLEAGQTSLADIRELATRLMDRALLNRARRLHDRVRHGTLSDGDADPFSELVRATARLNDGAPDLEAFKQAWARARSGIVLTAHPTFGISESLAAQMVELAASRGDLAPDRNRLPHRPDEPIDLAYEHRRAQSALGNLRNAMEGLLNRYYSVAHETFGDAAFEVKPRLATIASWVGYDLDGRTDITWLHSFRLRLQEKLTSLNDVRQRFLLTKHRLGEAPEVERLGRQLTGKLDLAIAAVQEQVQALDAIAADKSDLARAANIISASDGYNLTTVKPLVDLLDDLISVVDGHQMKRSLASLRGLIETTGLGTSHIHVRINAAQLDNALRALIREPWTQAIGERRAIQHLSERIKEAAKNPETVNFGTLELETATAIRQFALIAQIKKYVDAETPVRFLIAECESPATILIAVYIARLFGVADIVDISPLFETPDGLERGARLMEELLQEETYRDYVKERGRLSIQTGFSDAGRFVGQVAATLEIERLHLGLVEAIRAADIPEVETLIFSTHGESMGRGAHPGNLGKRLCYVLPHEVRRRFHQHQRPLKHETSFQGGDGFMFFADTSLTSETLATVIRDSFHIDERPDPFYSDENLSLDFFLRLRDYQQQLFAHPGYRAMLGAFGPNLLFKTGSRAMKRQSDVSQPLDRGDPSRMRAIPNNAILQQFGYIANVVAGLGYATGYDRGRFVELAKQSPRLIDILEMVARGKQLSSLNAMGANAYLFDAGFWASRASWGREPGFEPAFRQLSRALLSDKRASEINRLVHHMRLDAIDLHAILEDLGLEGGKVPDDMRLELDLLQAIRLSLIMHIFILAARLPRFAARNDMSYERVLDLALSLDVPEVVEFMRQAFPYRSASAISGEDYEEKASYRPHGVDEYGRLERELLAPMQETYECVREIGTGISHHFGAFG